LLPLLWILLLLVPPLGVRLLQLRHIQQRRRQRPAGPAVIHEYGMTNSTQTKLHVI
jgi:hypothetical protein